MSTTDDTISSAVARARNLLADAHAWNPLTRKYEYSVATLTEIAEILNSAIVELEQA